MLQFKNSIQDKRSLLKSLLRDLNNAGLKVFGYGASTKGNVILQYCGLTVKDIPYIAEVNPEKFGCYAPGTNIPIISEEEAHKMKPDYFLVLPWHFKDNIIEREKGFLNEGRGLIFPLPYVLVIKGGYKCREH